jgi:hypothetical protein
VWIRREVPWRTTGRGKGGVSTYKDQGRRSKPKKQYVGMERITESKEGM